jgi:HAE1 family hydrophobic/amphiphilic exporter-1
MKMGKNPIKAAIDGRKEIGKAAIAITLADVVVFAPIAFMTGIIGQFFRQFGFVVVFATLFSLLVSFTITPLMASRFFKTKEIKDKQANFLEMFIEGMGTKLKNKYRWLLEKALCHRVIVSIIVISLLFFSFSLVGMGLVGSEQMPSTDDSEFTVNIKLTPGTTIEDTKSKVSLVENYLKTISEVNFCYSRIGIENSMNKAVVVAKLTDPKRRELSQKDLAGMVRSWAKKSMSGSDVIITEPAKGAGEDVGGKPININVRGSKVEVLQDIANRIENIVKETKGTIEVRSSLEDGNPAFSIELDRTAAEKSSITAFDVSNAIRASVEGYKAGVFRKDAEEFDIRHT